MAIRLKGGRYGARLTVFQAAAVRLIVVDQVLTEMGIRYYVSSGIEGLHMIKSLHPKGDAEDYRLLRVTDHQGQLARKEISNRLADDFDVIWNNKKQIIHVEWQMKKPLGRL